MGILKDPVEEFDINDVLNSIPAKDEGDFSIGDVINNVGQYTEPALGKASAYDRLRGGMQFMAHGGPLGTIVQKPFIEAANKVIEPLKSISIEDWKNHSLLAPMLEYGLGSMTDPNSTETIAARNKLLEKAHHAYEGIKNITPESLYNLAGEVVKNPFGMVGEAAKGVIYDPEQIVLGGVAGKGLGKILETPINKVKSGYATLLSDFERAKGEFVEPKNQVTIENWDSSKPLVENEAVGHNLPSESVVKKEIVVPEEHPVNRAETSPFTPVELTDREALLRKVGHEDIRNSALEGNPKEASSQFITSQSSQEAYGSGMTNQINTEKAVQTKHLENIQKEVGGTTIRHGTEWQQGDKIKVGKEIKEGLQESFENYEKETVKLYNDANKLHGEKPVNLEKFDEFINSDENFTNPKADGLRKGIKSFLQKRKFLNEDGTIKPLTVAQSEQVRKYINSQYNFETKKLGGELKGSIDEDVFGQIGGETYENARAHFKKGIETYEDPKAMANLLGDKGVNQKIPDELVYSKLPSLDESQFTHLYNTLKENKQIKATNQIDNFLIDQIKQSGKSALNQPWNSVASATEAANLSNKLKIAFFDRPQILQKIYDNIEAGNILHIPARYPGAAVQTHLLKNKFSEMAIQRGATTLGAGAGGFVGGPFGAAAGAAGGEYLGEKGAASLRSGRQVEQLQKEIKGKSGTPLNKLNKYEMKD